MFRLTKKAVMENVDLMIELVLEEAESHVSLPDMDKMEIRLVCEEILANIVHYAYTECEDLKDKGEDGESKLSGAASKDEVNSEYGDMTVNMEFDDVKHELKLWFMDHGRPFNPLKKEKPDLNADISSRPVGGLGIYMVRQIANSVEYVRNGEQNELTVVKSCKGAGGGVCG